MEARGTKNDPARSRATEIRSAHLSGTRVDLNATPPGSGQSRLRRRPDGPGLYWRLAPALTRSCDRWTPADPRGTGGLRRLEHGAQTPRQNGHLIIAWHLSRRSNAGHAAVGVNTSRPGAVMSESEPRPSVYKKRAFEFGVPPELLYPSTQRILSEWGWLLQSLVDGTIAPTTERQRIFLHQISTERSVPGQTLCASAKAWIDLIATRKDFNERKERERVGETAEEAYERLLRQDHERDSFR
jgi:hypothetical protein